MTEREKLIKLVREGIDLPCGNGSPWEDDFCKGCKWENEKDCHAAKIADLLLANKCHSLPCDIGDTVYTNCRMQGWYFREKDKPYKAKIVFIGLNGVDNFMNVDFGNGHMLQFPFSEIGKTVFLTKEEALKVRVNK